MPGITRNACCPHGLRRATHCMRSAFVCHGQVQSTGCPWESAGKPLQRQLHSCGILLLWNHMCQAHPFKCGFFFLRHSQLIHMISFLNLRTQPSQFIVSIIGRSLHSTFYIGHRLHGTLSTQDTAFRVHCLHHRTQPSRYTVVQRIQPLRYIVLHRAQPSFTAWCLHSTQPSWYTVLHSTQPSRYTLLKLHRRTQRSQYTALNLHHRTQPLQYNVLHKT